MKTVDKGGMVLTSSYANKLSLPPSITEAFREAHGDPPFMAGQKVRAVGEGTCSDPACECNAVSVVVDVIPFGPGWAYDDAAIVVRGYSSLCDEQLIYEKAESLEAVK